jgi:hypothetical protein
MTIVGPLPWGSSGRDKRYGPRESQRLIFSRWKTRDLADARAALVGKDVNREHPKGNLFSARGK